jgi:hypothetical protein
MQDSTPAVASPELVMQVKQSNIASNLLRTLTHHRRMAQTRILTRAQSQQLQRVLGDTEEALRIMLRIE